MLHYVLHRIHNLRHAGLVVGAQQGSTVGSYDCLALMSEQLGEIGRVELQSGHALKGNGSAVVVLDYLRFNPGATGIGSGIYVRNEANRRHVALNIGGDGGHDISVFIERSLHAHCDKLVAEHLQQHQLLLGGRLGL